MVWPTKNDVKMSEYNAMELPGQQMKAAHATSQLEHALNLDVKAPTGCIRFTGIMATIGKSSANPTTLTKMIEAGMNLVQINLSYESREYHVESIKMIREVVKECSAKANRNLPLAIGARLTGRKIRTGKIADSYGDFVELKTGEQVKLTCDETYKDRCSAYTIFIDFPYFGEQLRKGNQIVIDNELITLRVDMISATTVTCSVESGGILGCYKTVTFPNIVLDMPNYSDKDKADLEMLVQQQVDFIVAPFIQNATMVTDLRHLLGEKGKKIAIIAKVQTFPGLENYDEILQVTNAVMISRQELGTEITPKKLGLAQKNLIARANLANVPISISAQLLNSMKENKNPLRSEILDITNCVLDGADVLVLSVETSAGINPAAAVSTMAEICKEAEACIWTQHVFRCMVEKTAMPCDQATATCLAAVLAANRLIASGIIAITTSGKCAQILSKFRPRCPIFAVTRYAMIARQLHLCRAVVPIIFEDQPDSDWQKDLQNRVTFCTQWTIAEGMVRLGDPLVIVSGWKQGANFTNTMRIIYAAIEPTLF